MLAVLGLIDVVMIANLLIMVIIGGYETFVSRSTSKAIPTSPSGCRTSMPACSRSSCRRPDQHLLDPPAATFINAANLSEHTIKWQVLIHVVFLISAVAMAAVDRMMTQNLVLQRAKH
jgi:uncharacterized membrane protein YqhA